MPDDDLYIGPIEHDPRLCRPGVCPGVNGCWCRDCERGEHPIPWRGPTLEEWLARFQEPSELEKRYMWGDR